MTCFAPILFSPTDRIQQDFEQFHAEFPQVYRLFIDYSYEKLRQGFTRYSARGIIFRIRWECDINPDRHGGFKINDHYSSRYARKLMDEYPRFEGFFELRELKMRTA